MISPTVIDRLLDFIEHCPLSPCAASAAADSLFPAQALDALPGAVVSGNALIDLSALPEGILRSGISLALLFASRVADASMRQGDVVGDWFAAYQSNLKRLGFEMPQTAVTVSSLPKSGVLVHRAIVPLLTVAFGGAGVGPVIKSALNGLKEIDNFKPWILLFEREVRKFDVREMHFAVAVAAAGPGIIEVRHVVVRLRIARTETSVLFFRITDVETTLDGATTTFFADEFLLAAVEPALRRRLEDDVGSFIAGADVELAAPAISRAKVVPINAEAAMLGEKDALRARLASPFAGLMEATAPEGRAVASRGAGTWAAERLRIAQARLEAIARTRLEHKESVARLIEDAKVGIAKLEEGDDAAVSDRQISAVEAVIEIDGSRPVLFVQDGTIDLGSTDLDFPTAEIWQYAANEYLAGIERAAQAVGAVQLPEFGNLRFGTAFAVAPNLVLTNRHVAEEMAWFDGQCWRLRYKTEIEFGGEYDRTASKRFTVREIVAAGPERIDRNINFNHCDFAIMRVEGSGEFPKPLVLADGGATWCNATGGPPPVFAVGFPGEPKYVLTGSGGGQPVPPAGGEYDGVLRALFHDAFATKRWSPGYVRAAPGELAGDRQAWVIAYDASTLAGSSGSCVVDFSNADATVVGLHFGGRARLENWAHAVWTVTAIGDYLKSCGLK